MISCENVSIHGKEMWIIIHSTHLWVSENWTDVIMIRTRRDNRVVRESLGGFSGRQYRIQNGYVTRQSLFLSYGALLFDKWTNLQNYFQLLFFSRHFSVSSNCMEGWIREGTNLYIPIYKGILFMSSLLRNCTILMFVINKL